MKEVNFKKLHEKLNQVIAENNILQEDENRMNLLKGTRDFLKSTGADQTEIGQELMDTTDFAGDLYLTAEEFTREERSHLTTFCINMVDAAKGKATLNVEHFIKWLANILDRIMNDEYIVDRALSDDGYAYAINSLDMPNKLLMFAEHLDLMELANALKNDETCAKAVRLADELEQEYNK